MFITNNLSNGNQILKPLHSILMFMHLFFSCLSQQDFNYYQRVPLFQKYFKIKKQSLLSIQQSLVDNLVQIISMRFQFLVLICLRLRLIYK